MMYNHFGETRSLYTLVSIASQVRIQLSMVFFLSPLFFIVRFVALLPVNVYKIRNNTQIDFKFSNSLVLSSFLQLILIGYSAYAQNIRDNSDVYKGNIRYTLTPTLTLTGTCLNWVMHVLPIFCLLTARQKVKVYKTISDLPLFLHGGTLKARPRFISYFLLILVSCIICIYIYSFRKEYVFQILYYNEYLKIVLSCTVIEFYEVVSDIEDCFHKLNDMLPEVFERCCEKETVRYSVPPVDNTQVSAFQSTDLDLSDVFEFHRQLCCIVEELNRVYGYQNLAAVVFIFLHLIYVPLVVLSFPDHYMTWDILMCAISTVIMFILIFYTLVRPCSLISAEAKRTVAIVSKLMGKSPNEDFFMELEMYCRQLFLRKVEFSACGFFTLEIPLILSMLSIVTTYFTIILQFQMTDSQNVIQPTSLATIVQLNSTNRPMNH